MSGEEEQLKGGHAPAIKVGGKRVASHKSSGGDKTEPMTEEDIQEFGSPPKADTHHQSVLVSGVVMKGDQEFTTQAVRQFHDKPAPAHEKRPMPQNYNIHQPKK